MKDLEIKLGRPSKLTPELRAMLINACKLGMGRKQKDLATLAGVGEDTFSAWKKKHTEFFLELNQAKQQGRLAAVSKLWELIERGNYQAIRYYLEATSKEWRVGLNDDDGESSEDAARALYEAIEKMRNSIPPPVNPNHNGNGRIQNGTS